ncbi:LysR family transcriptional regulator [Vibrio lamellibrachiae]|uniref:LysR family transcriptional regulator n=1 Tax=Vibrio lamellibrachiae TaxID=2910253 RepID=UPI003D134D9F
MNWESVCFDWNRTRAFLVTAEEGTLSGAATALNMTQPTLSRQVAALEKEIGVTLFERAGQRLELTSSGLELLEAARRMGEAACEFSLTAKGQSQALEGRVVVSACQLDAVYRLPKIIAKLREKEPGITIEVVVTNNVSDIKRREADIAIRSFKPTQPSLIARKLGDELVHLYGKKEYLKPFSSVTTPQELKDIQIIAFNCSTTVSEQLNKQGWQLSERNFRVITECQLMQLQLCKTGLGLIYLTQDVGDIDPELKRAFNEYVAPIHLPVWIVCHEELHTNLRIRRVFDLISEEMKLYLAKQHS